MTNLEKNQEDVCGRNGILYELDLRQCKNLRKMLDVSCLLQETKNGILYAQEKFC